MSGGGCGALHTSRPRSGVRWAEAARGSPAGPLLTKLASSRASLSGARALAGRTAANDVDKRKDVEDDKGSEDVRRPRLVYRSSVRLLLLPVVKMANNRHRDRPNVAIVRPAIRLPKEAKEAIRLSMSRELGGEELGSMSAPATPAMSRATMEEKPGRKVPKSVASMVRR